MSSPLVSAATLSHMLRERDEPPVLLDVRWEPAPPGAGARREEYEQGHIPGAVFVDLDRELAHAPGAGGRHPLPASEAFEQNMRSAGVRADRPVVIYDGASSMAAARGWWVLRYFGHPDVAVLDGGLAGWVAAGGVLARGTEELREGDFVARPGRLAVLDSAAVAALAYDGVLLDARAPERFAGVSEPFDPVAGHIPGARNRPTACNVRESGEFLDPDQLRAEFEELGAVRHASIGVYCGSGVTAAHEILALELAGLEAGLYPGSWSQWIRDPSRPVATGL